MISRNYGMSNGGKRAQQLIKIDLAVLPLAKRYFLYCLTAKQSGLCFWQGPQTYKSIALLNFSPSSLTPMPMIISTRVLMSRSSPGLLKTIYVIKAQYKSCSALTKNSSPSFPLPFVLWIRALTNFKISTSFLMYESGFVVHRS